MVSFKEVQDQLKEAGADLRFWGRAEAKELQHILLPGEIIKHAVTGRYEGGFALLVATDFRVVLIDKKPFYLTMEDVRYDMISEVDYAHRLIDSTIHICTLAKKMTFTSMRGRNLRVLTTYIQQRVMEWRQHSNFSQQLAPAGAPASAIGQMPGQPGMQPLPTMAEMMAAQSSGTGLGRVATQGTQYNPGNPYTRAPLIMRKRVARFFPASQ